MKKKFICAANWKMNKGPEEAREFLNTFISQAAPDDLQRSIFFPTAMVSESFSAKGNQLKWGPQNIYVSEKGAFTGENSGLLAKEMGAQFVLVGHSERRSLFEESDQLLSSKVKLSQDLGLCPVLCVGESLAQRESGEWEAILKLQLTEGLSQANFEKPFWIAYEPVWAIGTGQVASPELANSAHHQIKLILKALHPEKPLETPVLYGGSVKADNAKALCQENHIDGFLIGGASLKVDSFTEILELTSE